MAPIVWHAKWPQEVANQLVTVDNPNSNITNLDLEMAAEVLGWLVLEANVTTRHAHARA